MRLSFFRSDKIVANKLEALILDREFPVVQQVGRGQAAFLLQDQEYTRKVRML
jgi:hypothetical protein